MAALKEPISYGDRVPRAVKWQESELTCVLRDIFSARSVCVILAAVSGHPDNIGQTFLTTVFAEKCRAIK